METASYKISYEDTFYYCDQSGQFATVEELANPSFVPYITNVFKISQPTLVVNTRTEEYELIFNPLTNEVRMANAILYLLVDSEQIEEAFLQSKPRINKWAGEPWPFGPLSSGNGIAIGTTSIAVNCNSIAIGQNASASGAAFGI